MPSDPTATLGEQIFLVMSVVLLSGSVSVFFLAQFGKVGTRIVRATTVLCSLFLLAVFMIAARDYSATRADAANCNPFVIGGRARTAPAPLLIRPADSPTLRVCILHCKAATGLL